MNKDYREHLFSSFSVAILHFHAVPTSRYCYYEDNFFRDYVKMTIHNGINLYALTYEVMKPLEESLESPYLYSLFSNFFSGVGGGLNTYKIRKELLDQGYIRESKLIRIPLAQYDLVFDYYDYVFTDYYNKVMFEKHNVHLNSLSDDEIIGRNGYRHTVDSFRNSVASAYSELGQKIIEQYNHSGLFTNILENLGDIAEVRYKKEKTKREEDWKNLKENGCYVCSRIHRDEWGNELG